MNEKLREDIYQFGHLLESIYTLKQEIPLYTDGWKKAQTDELQGRKYYLFWMEVLYLFQAKLLAMKVRATTIRLRIELDRAEGTVLYRFESDPKGEKRAFVSEKYNPEMLWDITQSPIGGVGLIRKQLNGNEVVLELWFPV